MNIKSVLTADIKKSKNLEETARMNIQKNIFNLINLFENSYQSDIFSASMTTGDEFQVVINHPSKVYDIYKTIRNKLSENIYAGIGFGEIEFVENRQSPSEMYGTAFYNSRDAIEKAKEKNLDIYFYTGRKTLDMELNTIIQLILFIRNKWTKRQQKILKYYESHKNILQKEVAEHFKISEAAVSKTIKISGYEEVKRGELLIKDLLKRIENPLSFFEKINPRRLRCLT